jgi:hypothetical protein
LVKWTVGWAGVGWGWGCCGRPIKNGFIFSLSTFEMRLLDVCSAAMDELLCMNFHVIFEGKNLFYIILL